MKWSLWFQLSLSRKKALLYCMELMSVSVSIKVSKCLHKSYQTRCSKMWSFSHSFKQFPKIDVFDHIYIKYLFHTIYFNCLTTIQSSSSTTNYWMRFIIVFLHEINTTVSLLIHELMRLSGHMCLFLVFGWIPFAQYLFCGIMFCYNCLFSIQWVLFNILLSIWLL